MKYPIISTVKAILILSFSVPVLMTGCGKGDNLNVGYYYISIPEYSANDYFIMLDNKNEEIRYNAICYLSENTNYSEILSTDSLKGTPRFNEALKCYNKIYPMMSSGNAWVSSAAIRFINSFKYKRKEFLQDILSNNSGKINVQLEIVQDLMLDMDEEKNVLYQKYRFLKEQPSWLLQNSAYLLNDSLSEQHIAELLSDYRTSKEEYKNLLILDALSIQKDSNTANFLIQEWQVSTNPRIKKMLLSTWLNIASTDQLITWFVKNPKELLELMPSIAKSIDYDTTNDISLTLTIIALNNGWDPAKHQGIQGTQKDSVLEIFTRLFSKIHDSNILEESPTLIATRQSNTQKILDAIFNRPDLKKRWTEYEQSNLKYPLSPEFLAKHDSLTRDYLEKTGKFCREYNIDTATAISYITSCSETARRFHSTKVKKRTP